MATVNNSRRLYEAVGESMCRNILDVIVYGDRIFPGGCKRLEFTNTKTGKMRKVSHHNVPGVTVNRTPTNCSNHVKGMMINVCER